MNEQRHFHFAATAQLVFDPMADQLIAANQEACKLLRLDVPQLLERRVSQIFAPSFPWLVVFTQQVLSAGHAWSDQLEVAMVAGNQRLEVTGRCSAVGEELVVYLNLQRVVEVDAHRQKSEAHQHYLSGLGNWDRVARIFQEFERENRLLLDAAGEGIYGVDTNGVTTFVNPAAQDILGYSAEELAGKNMHSTVHHSHLDGSHFGIDECPIFVAFREGRVQAVDNDVFWTKNNRSIEVEYTCTPVRDSGVIVGAVVVFRDVSLKKANERELQNALTEVEHLKNRLELEKAYLQEEIKSEFNHHQIVGHSPALQQVLRQIDLVAPTEATVMITGETGTGKELIARALHDSSLRSERPLIRVNCAAIPEELFESEFFGHVKGAFTGASQDRPGRFALADGGTLFLDEVGEIPIRLQGKLLRVLQEQTYERVGEATTCHCDVRVIAATNRDLTVCVSEGTFREDLYFRLNVFPIESVALRHRQEDIVLLAQHFLRKACVRANKPELKIPLGEIQKLLGYAWPGNIRELENVIERQVILAQGETLRFEGLLSTELMLSTSSDPSRLKTVYTDREMKQLERRNILLALERCHGKVFGTQGAAEMLSMKPTTLMSRVNKYQINLKEFGSPSR